MKDILLFTIAAIASVASATPPAVVERATISRSFRLRTQFISGKESFGNQYFYASHTGAGLGIPAFIKSASDGEVGYLNGTTANFLLTGSTQNLYSVLALAYPADLYAGWGPLTLDVAGVGTGVSTTDPASSGFSIGSSGFFTHTKGGQEQFEGWRVCNWVHGVPELFFDTEENSAGDVPESCARVYLVPEYV